MSIKRILFLVIIIILAFELIFRFSLKDSFDGRFDYGYRPGVGIRESSNGEVQFRSTAGRKFWPQTYNSKKENATIRIIVVGDSIARGSSLQNSYPKLLEDRLNKLSENKYEIWNLSIPGYGTERKKIILLDILKYQPDLVILHSGLSNEFEDERDKRFFNQYQGWHPQHWPMKSYLLRWLDEIQQQRIKIKLLSPEIRNHTATNDIDDEHLASKDRENILKWQRVFKSETRESIELLNSNKIPYLYVPRVIHNPEKNEVDDDGLYETLIPLLKGDVFIDLKLIFNDLKASDLFSKDNIHLTNKGHEVISDILLKKLIKQ